MGLKKLLLTPCFFTLLFFHFTAFSSNKSILDSLKHLLKKNSIQDSNKVKLLNDIGGYLISDRNYDEALNFLEQGKALAEKLDYKSGIIISLNRTGLIYMDKSLYPKALEYFNTALAITKKGNYKKSEADLISNMGIVYSDQGQYVKALQNYMNALRIRESIYDTSGISGSMMSIANIYYLQNKYEMALEFYQKILKIKGVEKNKYFNALVLNNIGLAYMQLKNYPTALSYFYSTLNIDNEIDDKQGVALVYTNIGKIYYIQGNYSKALEVSLIGFEILNELNDKKSVAESSGEIGVIYDSLKQPEKALECYKKQLVISKAIGNKVNIRKAYLFFSNHYQLVNNYKEAYNYYTLFKSIEDSIKNESSIKAIAELEAKYETQNKEKEIELLKKEQQLQSAESQRQKQFIIACFILAVIIALLFFLFYNSQQLKKKSQLEKKNFELERNALSAQMNPHFIFNSLGSISGFITENDKDKAIEYLGIFSRLIRHNLEQSREQLVAVVQEAKMLQSYLFLQQLRYNNKFNFQIEVDENIDPSLAIPPMFIQPFVENAILHGIIPKDGQGFIFLKFYLKGSDQIICEIKDDGIGKLESLKRKKDTLTDHKSLAMTITEERIQIINSMNKEQIQLTSIDITDNNNLVIGTLVQLIFPIDHI